MIFKVEKRKYIKKDGYLKSYTLFFLKRKISFTFSNKKWNKGNEIKPLIWFHKLEGDINVVLINKLAICFESR